MSSALPQPSESTESSGHDSSTPVESGPTVGFAIGWDVFRIAVWVLIAVWVYPRLLVFVGGGGIANWLLHHRWVRIMGVPPLGLLALISAFDIVNDPRKRGPREKVARGMGATVVTLRMDPTYGIPTGPGLRVPLGRESMVVGTWKGQGKSHTVASVTVDTRSPFSFVARGTDREPAMIRGLQQLVVGQAMRQVAEQGDSRAAVAAATLGYMAEPPMTTGNDALDRAMVLRANQPDTARALFTSSGVAAAVAALDAKTRRWDWTFFPASTAGRAEMRLECPGALSDTESLKLVQSLMQAALEELTRAGVLAG